MEGAATEPAGSESCEWDSQPEEIDPIFPEEGVANEPTLTVTTPNTTLFVGERSSLTIEIHNPKSNEKELLVNIFIERPLQIVINTTNERCLHGQLDPQYDADYTIGSTEIPNKR